jgi:hypothetical protein
VKITSVIVLLIFGFLVYGCSPKNVDFVKAGMTEKWRRQGYQCMDYDGWTAGFGIGHYGGSHVWCRLKRIPDDGILYDGWIERWGDELHVYGPTAVSGQTLNFHQSTSP